MLKMSSSATTVLYFVTLDTYVSVPGVFDDDFERNSNYRRVYQKIENSVLVQEASRLGFISIEGSTLI